MKVFTVNLIFYIRLILIVKQLYIQTVNIFELKEIQVYWGKFLFVIQMILILTIRKI